jgi:hypothetical protein
VLKKRELIKSERKKFVDRNSRSMFPEDAELLDNDPEPSQPKEKK